MTRIWADTRCRGNFSHEYTRMNTNYRPVIGYLDTPEICVFRVHSRQILPCLIQPNNLQRLYLAGFDLQTFDRFPKAIGVLRDNCIAFLVPGGPEGLQILGNVGWRMGESLGPLVEREGRKVFLHKQEILEATPERIATLERFGAT